MRMGLNKQEISILMGGIIEVALTWAVYLALRYGVGLYIGINGLLSGALLFLPFYLYEIYKERMSESWFRLPLGVAAYGFAFVLVLADSYLLSVHLHFPLRAQDVGLNLFTVYLLLYVVVYASFVYRMQGPKGMWQFYFRKYAKPVFEDKVVMFLDVDGSTAIAERIGHRQFISFLNDFFVIVTDLAITYNGEIHKYVGDEVIIFWAYDKVRSNAPVAFFRSAVQAIEEKAPFFRRKYALEKVGFKAGLHAGPVVVGELGKYKKAIVFAGDTMNVTARLEGISKQKNCRLVVTADYLNLVREPGDPQSYPSLGRTALRGKQEQIELYCAFEPWLTDKSPVVAHGAAENTE